MVNVNVVQGGDFAANALLYQQPSQTLMTYLHDNMNNVMSRLSNVSDAFKTSVVNLYNSAHDSKVLNQAKLLLNSLGTTLNQNVIYHVPYQDIHNPNPIMQQYIMSEPTLNKLHKQNRCYGYQDTYVEVEPDTYGQERVLYQRVMDGVMQFDEEGLCFINHYTNSDEVELTTVEKISVLDTWRHVRRLIAEGIDPTDPDKNEF